MQAKSISLDETDCFSQAFINYIGQNKELEPFYNAYPSIDNFQKTIQKRNFPNELRMTLSSALKEQYAGLEMNELVSDNIQKLKETNTFTITTGHQLNIFTGPLYFIYKIVSVINACKSLKKTYPDYEFVPVYWMASEDHDFEEISYFHFEGEKVQWSTTQKGAVGRFNPSELKEIAKQLPQGARFFEEAYSQETLAKAVRHYVNYLFGSEGLVVIDADDTSLKKALIPVIHADLFDHTPQDLVSKTSTSLEGLGYKSQVHAREINFFYLQDDIRERIEKTENGFEVVDTELRFSTSEMKELIQKNPERFSPNVILRPLYQETILPNLAYIGGPSEAVYWLQLKAVFDHFKVAFPLLMPRNFALVIDQTSAEKWAKTDLTHSDLFLDKEQAFSKWVNANTEKEISFSQDLKQLVQSEAMLKDKAKAVDPTLVQHIEALYASFAKRIEKAEKKLVRAEKRRHTEKRQQIASVKDTLFPGGTLQERKDNFLNFYLSDPHFITHLLDTFDAFDFQMYLLFE